MRGRSVTAEELEKRIRAEGIPITPAGLLRERAAAQVLGVAPRTLREWRLAEKPPPWHRLSGTIRYHVADLAAFITSGRREPPH
jgi:hypothetical protein